MYGQTERVRRNSGQAMVEPIDRVLAMLAGVRETGRGWMARCPAHADDNPSLSVMKTAEGRVIFNCFGGCAPHKVLDALGLRFEDLRPGPPPGSVPAAADSVTLAQLAEAKGLPQEYLRRQGLRESRNAGDGRAEVEIPYYRADGVLYAVKRRTSVRASRGSFWPRGVPLLLYGLHQIEWIRRVGWVFLVEGETDTLTLTWHNLPALGVPGAKAVDTITAEALEGVRCVYIGCEPDGGGDHFREAVRERLREIGFRGARRFITWPAEAKDPNLLYLSAPRRFVDHVRARMREADREARARRMVYFPAMLLGVLAAEEIACLTALLYLAWDREDGRKEARPTAAQLAALAGFLGPTGEPDTTRCGRVVEALIGRGLVEVAGGGDATVFLLRRPDEVEGDESG